MFRAVGASLYAKQKKYDDAIKMLKKDKLYKDAIETAKLSGKEDTVKVS